MDKNYCSSFMNHVGGGADPHECWQEDGFWPDRVTADLRDLYVWGCELALSYCNSGDVIQYLEHASGRTLPEMLEGFHILDCQQCAAIAQCTIEKFGSAFPRNDHIRKEYVGRNEQWFVEFNVKLFHAWQLDKFDLKSGTYYENYCLQRDIPPWGPDYHPARRRG